MMHHPLGRASRAVLALAAAGIAGACALVDPNNMLGRQSEEPESAPSFVVPPPRSTLLTVEQRERAFDFVWNTIQQRYHDPRFNGVDWRAVGDRYRPLAMAAADDETFWDTLDRMTGELHDPHTRVESPRRVALRNRDESVSLGFFFRPVEGRLVVVNVNAESDAYWAGVRPGMTIVNMAGEPAAAAYQKLLADSRMESNERSRHLQAVRRLTTGEVGTKVAFTFERADGTHFDATLERRKLVVHPTEAHRVLPSGFGYVRFTRWTIGLGARALTAIDEMHGAPGLIIDLRGNPGGALLAVNNVLSRFFAQRTELGRTTTRSGEPISLFMGAIEIIKLKQTVEGDPKAYTGPVVILVNSQSASGSELFAGSMQAVNRAKVVGEPSCGCLLGFLGYARIPGGAELAYSEVGFVLADGRKVEGEGVIPDVVVPATQSDLQLNRDRTLEEAQRVLAQMAGRTP